MSYNPYLSLGSLGHPTLRHPSNKIQIPGSQLYMQQAVLYIAGMGPRALLTGVEWVLSLGLASPLTD